MRLLFTIDNHDYQLNDQTRVFVRPSSRAIIIKNNQIAMVHSLKYHYYKFPGGGIEPSEKKESALIRETKEEAGLIIKPDTIKEFGYVHRIQKSNTPDCDVFVQDNYYYLCDVEDQVISQDLDDYEDEEQFTLEFVNPIDAININLNYDHQYYDQNRIIREAKVLQILIDEGLIKIDKPKAFLGIDGGGTKTKFCLIDENKQIIAETVTGPTSLDTVEKEVTIQNITDGIKNLKLNNYQVLSVYMGVGGITCHEDEQEVEKILRSFDELKNSHIQAESDVNNALLTMNGEKEGIVVIMGTGSVAFGVHNQKSHRCGGYCYQEGDKGSAYDLGISAMRILARVMDGRLIEDDFTKELMEVTNCDNFNSVAKYLQNLNRTTIASLSKIVTKHPNSIYAKKIMDDGISEVLLMIKTVYEKLKFDDTNLVIVGSLGLADTYYHQHFVEELNKLNLNITIKESSYEPSLASAIYAYNLNNK